jgi:2-oxoglutarate dehydrogenase E1 component
VTPSNAATMPEFDIGLLSSEYVEQFYSLYQDDPTKVPAEWQAFFRSEQNKPSKPAKPKPATTLRAARDVAPMAATPALTVSIVEPSTAPTATAPAPAPIPGTPSPGKSNGVSLTSAIAPAGNGTAVSAPTPVGLGNGASMAAPPTRQPDVVSGGAHDIVEAGDGTSANGEATGDLPISAGRVRDSQTQGRLQESVDLLIRNYRVRGHLIAKVDPLGIPRAMPAELEPKFWGLTDADLDRQFSTYLLAGSNTQTLRDIMERLRNTYCGSISAQFMHIDDLQVREWLQGRMEESQNRLKLSRAEQLRILTRLTDAVIFEEFIRRKFVGAKSFSLEGAESLIPLLDLAIEKAASQGIESIVMAMAHRGRLNVLANIIGKCPQDIFREFEDIDPELYRGGGDVKYHLGYYNDYVTSTGQRVHLSLCFNPSHLEFVNPVALGLTRAKQDRGGDVNHERNMAILIHGDAAFIGEGIVQETLNLSQLPGYAVGGTVHVVINNQIGFTTPPEQSRSTVYATDIAKMLQIPIFHVNGEQPEAVAQVISLALDFRATFRRDVVIDMYCYRRWGHNESDEPAFTQPLLYKWIENHKSVRDAYQEHLLALGEISQSEADQIVAHRRENLEYALSLAKREDFVPRPKVLGDVWKGYHGGPERLDDDVETGVPLPRLTRLMTRLTELPDDFHIHPKLKRMLESRRQMAAGKQPLDWAAAEALAYASLAMDGYRVRLSGQDSIRGTFSHRHAAFYDTEDGHSYFPLKNLAPDQMQIEIHNSPLSEAGVMGFEYGYSLGYPDALVLWEAQFGDFANAAQVIIDQFIVSAEEKWRHLSGVVLLLPHGFEGQGPEHSSARVERFLRLGNDENVQVVVPTTPAQFFHVLRRQAIRRWKKPLIALTPKSLLRHPACVSTLEELTRGRYQRVIPDPTFVGKQPSRVLICSGKVYYELLEIRNQRQPDVAILRLEQMHPLPVSQLKSALEHFADGTPVVWVQEEPKNMSAWYSLKIKFGKMLFGRFPFSEVNRAESATPATGSACCYRLEQKELLARAFGEL